MKLYEFIMNEDEEKIADLEAANILLTRTINEQAQVIREHQAADVIAVEAIRAQADEIARLKKKISYVTTVLLHV